MAELAKDISTSIQTSVDNSTERTRATVTELIRGYDETQQQRFREQDENLQHLQSMQAKQHVDHTAIAARVKELERLMAVAEKAVGLPTDPAVRDAASWTRNTDAAIIVLNTATLISKESLAKVVSGWVGAVATGEQFRLEGAALSRRFVVRFVGEQTSAARRCRMAFEALRNSDGSWVQLEVELPTGGKTTVYAAPDKNKQQAARERFSKHLQKAIQATTDQPVHLVRRDGLCTVSWTQVVKVEPLEDGTCHLRFNGDACTKFGLDKDKIKTKFEEFASSRPVATIQWSI